MLPLRARSIVSVILFTMLTLACVAIVHAAPALAASADISVSADNAPPTPSGAASTYTINFTCSAVVGNSCGPNPVITIPLNAAPAGPPKRQSTARTDRSARRRRRRTVR